MGKARWKWHAATCHDQLNFMLRHDVSFMSKFKPANQKHYRLFMNVCSQSQELEASKCWQHMFGLATDVPNVSMKLHEALWRHHEVVLRTGLRTYFWQKRLPMEVYIKQRIFKSCDSVINMVRWYFNPFHLCAPIQCSTEDRRRPAGLGSPDQAAGWGTFACQRGQTCQGLHDPRHGL